MSEEADIWKAAWSSLVVTVSIVATVTALYFASNYFPGLQFFGIPPDFAILGTASIFSLLFAVEVAGQVR